jgi:hypothetical protein
MVFGSSQPREIAMTRPVSISVGDISKHAKTTVEMVLAGHKSSFPTIPEHRIGYVPQHWWFGFVMYNWKNDNLTLNDAQKLATELHQGISASVSGAKAGKPGVVLADGNLTIGFAPPVDVNIFEP